MIMIMVKKKTLKSKNENKKQKKEKKRKYCCRRMVHILRISSSLKKKVSMISLIRFFDGTRLS